MIPESHKPAYKLLGVMCAVIVCIWCGSVFISYPARPHQNNRYSSDDKAANGNPIFPAREASKNDESAIHGKKQTDEGADLQLWFNGTLAVCGLITIGVLIGQVCINSNQLRTQRAELRAYVSFELKVHEPKPGQEVKFWFTCKNHGKTPAIEIGFRGGVWIRPTPFNGASFPQIAPGFDEERINLFPEVDMKERVMIFHVDTGTKFTAEQIHKAQLGPDVFVFGMRIRYKDIFGAFHETQEFWQFRERTLYGEWFALIPSRSVVT